MIIAQIIVSNYDVIMNTLNRNMQTILPFVLINRPGKASLESFFLFRLYLFYFNIYGVTVLNQISINTYCEHVVIS